MRAAQVPLSRRTEEGGEGEGPGRHLGAGHGDVEQVVGDDGGQAQQEEQLPALHLDGLVYHLPLLALAAQPARHAVPQEIPVIQFLVSLRG